MMIERRNDLGIKLSWLLIATMITGFAGVAWAAAIRGETKADRALEENAKNNTEIAVLKANMNSILYRLDEIKLLVNH